MLNPFLHNPFQEAPSGVPDPDDPFEKIFRKYLERINAIDNQTAGITTAAPQVETPTVELPEGYTSTVGKTSENITRSLLASAKEEGIEPSPKLWVGQPLPRQSEGPVESLTSGLDQGWDILKGTWYTAMESMAETGTHDDPLDPQTIASQALTNQYAALRRQAFNDASITANAISHNDKFSTYVLNTVAQMLPTTLATIGVAIGTGKIGAATGITTLLGKAGFLATGAGSFAVAYPQIKGEIQTRMEAEGVDVDAADASSSVHAFPAALLESVFETTLVTGKLFKGGPSPRIIDEGILDKIAARAASGVRGMTRGSVLEAITEAAQTAIEEVAVSQTVEGEMPDIDETLEQM